MILIYCEVRIYSWTGLNKNSTPVVVNSFRFYGYNIKQHFQSLNISKLVNSPSLRSCVSLDEFVSPMSFQSQPCIGSGRLFGRTIWRDHCSSVAGGLTENAGPENAGPQKQDRKMEDKQPKAIT